MKIFEYFYAGKPVLSTKIAELTKKHFNGLVYYGNKEEWSNHIKFLINNQWSKEKRKKQRSMALANTWDKKISQILKQLH
jgi:glycosyltransferase involved in cell wall biosynthesis